MDGFQPYIPLPGTLKKLNPKSPILNYSQKGSGSTPSIKVVSPTVQAISQAKENLKRNKTELNEFLLPSKKVKQNTPPSKSETKKPTNKSQKVHKRYGKKK